MNRLPLPQPTPSPFTPDEVERAKLYTTHVVHEIELALLGEIEKIEGRIPGPGEMHLHGRCFWNKDMSQDYYWKGILLVTVKPNQEDEDGHRGTLLVIHKQPERALEDDDDEEVN